MCTADQEKAQEAGGLECHLAQNKQARDQKVGCLGALERLEPGSLWLKVYVPC